MPFPVPEDVLFLLHRLESAGGEGYLVGGCVRDMLLGVLPGDYDLAVSLLPSQVMELFQDQHVIPTGLSHGTVTVVLHGTPYELTTYRQDGSYTDHRHPDGVTFCRSIQEDLARRDFTVNAMAYHPDRGLLDPYSGRADLVNKKLRAVGEPTVRFSEDALRMMRLLRFSAKLGFAPTQETWDAAMAGRQDLQNIAVERIFAELKKLLCGDYAGQVLQNYAPVLFAALPELAVMEGVPQNNPWHLYDVWEHTTRAVDAVPPQPCLRLTMLFHDSGKPACRFTDEAGMDHFYRHPQTSAQIAADTLTRLKCDNATKDQVISLVRWHDVMLPATDPVVRRWMGRLGPEGFRDLLLCQKADTLAHAPGVVPQRLEQIAALEEIRCRLLQEKACFTLSQLAVHGRDLLALGIPPGRQIGTLLQTLLEAVVEERLPNEKEALLTYIKGLL